MFFLAGRASSPEQENVPPNSSPPGSASPTRTPESLSCALSNPSLTSSEPNILRPRYLSGLDQDGSFPVDAPSPLSPYEETRGGPRRGRANRAQAHAQRPFSELFSDDGSGQGSRAPYDSHRELDTDPPLVETTAGDSTENRELDEVGEASQSSADEQRADSPGDVGGDEDGPVNAETSNRPERNDDAREASSSPQPMEVTDEVGEASGGLDEGAEAAATGDPVESPAPRLSSPSSSSSSIIELTEDSPLRILEENEMRSLEEAALSHDELSDDSSEDSSEYMDTLETCQPDRANTSPETTEDDAPEVDGNAEVDSAEDGSADQRMASPEADENESAPVEPGEAPVPVSNSQAVIDGSTVAQAVNSNESSEVTTGDAPCAADAVAAATSGNSSGEEGPAAALMDPTAMEEEQENPPHSTSSDPWRNRLGVSQGIEISPANFPLEAAEPVCLDAASVEAPSTSQMLVESTPALRDRGRAPAESTIPEGARSMARSNSGPRRSTGRRRRTATEEPIPSPNPPRPQLRRRAESSPLEFRSVTQQPSGVTQRVTTCVTEEALPEDPGPDPVLMAVAMSPTRSPAPDPSSPILVADGSVDSRASVTPLPSPGSPVSRSRSATPGAGTATPHVVANQALSAPARLAPAERPRVETTVIYATRLLPGGGTLQTYSLPGHARESTGGRNAGSSTMETPRSSRVSKSVVRQPVSSADSSTENVIGAAGGLPSPGNGSSVSMPRDPAKSATPSRETIQTMLKTYVRTTQGQKPPRPPKGPKEISRRSSGAGAQQAGGSPTERPRRTGRKRQMQGGAVQLQVEDRPPPPPPPRAGGERRPRPAIEGDRQVLPPSKQFLLFSSKCPQT